MSSRGERHIQAQTSWLPVPPLVAEREGLAELGETSLYFQDTGGSGEVMVLSHSWTGSYAVWAYQQSVFAAAGYRVITFSARGHYPSAAIDPDSPGSSTADMRALIDYLDIDRAHIVATAGGCLPALDYALAHPERTISVTLSSGHMGISDPDYVAINMTLFPKGATGLTPTFREVGPSYRTGNREGLAAWEELEHAGWQRGPVRQKTESLITFARIEAELCVPTLLMTGDADLVMPPSRIRGVAPYMPHAEMVFVAEAGHALHWEQPEAFNSAVLDFVGRHPDASPRRD